MLSINLFLWIAIEQLTISITWPVDSPCKRNQPHSHIPSTHPYSPSYMLYIHECSIYIRIYTYIHKLHMHIHSTYVHIIIRKYTCISAIYKKAGSVMTVGFGGIADTTHTYLVPFVGYVSFTNIVSR